MLLYIKIVYCKRDYHFSEAPFMVWEEVGKRIENLRHDRKLTQAQLGSLVGVSGQYVGKIEKGLNKLPVELIVAIYKETGVSADYILFGVSDPLNNIASLTELSPEQIEICFDILKRLAEFINTENGNEVLIKELMRQQKFV